MIRVNDFCYPQCLFLLAGRRRIIDARTPTGGGSTRERKLHQWSVGCPAIRKKKQFDVCSVI